MGLGASAHAALAEDPCHGRDNPLEGGGERLDAHLAAASARLRAIRASFSWPYEAGDDPRGDGVALPLERMAEMLLPGERALEQGWVRRANGEYFVASRALMPGATGAMLQWWFSWCDTGYKYRLWHPEDHVWCTWSARALATAVAERRPGCWIGESHIVVEHMGKAFGGPAEDIRIEFRDPAAYGLTPELLAAARPRVVAVFTARVCAREPGLGDVAAGHFIHVARELPSGGIELRSRFWLGCAARVRASPGPFANALSRFARSLSRPPPPRAGATSKSSATRSCRPHSSCASSASSKSCAASRSRARVLWA